MGNDPAEIRRDVIEEFLALPSERPSGGILRCLAVGICVGVLLLADMSIMSTSPFLRFTGLIITGWSLAFFGWGTERLWYNTIGQMFLRPVAWYAYLTRLPFWFIGGGIGYTFGLLVSERCGLLSVQDIPVKPLFVSGSYFGLLLQFVLQVRIYRFVRRDHRMKRKET